MTREEDDGISVALDPQTLISGFCISAEWEVVCLEDTTLVEVILVKGHELPTIVKVAVFFILWFILGVCEILSFFLLPGGFVPQLLVEQFTPIEDNTCVLESDVSEDSTCLMLLEDVLRGSTKSFAFLSHSVYSSWV
ncbi:hypothetical protein Tco_1125401 [Tanacetum coccineum]|uniref:Uncharacterized protein n=1 Tax=Tanacetum coccineum TaxID=301880 RepID=A0ABQ5J9J9_9ASTR